MQELEDILGYLVDNIDGALVAAISSMDGLLIEQQPPDAKDLSATSAELTNLLTGAKNALTLALNSGDLKEVLLFSERNILYTRILGSELFCTVVMNPSGNAGKARLYTEKMVNHLLETLS